MQTTWLAAYGIMQFLYLGALLVCLWFYTNPVDLIEQRDADAPRKRLPKIVLLYPVLRELEGTMRTTLLGMAQADYPAGFVQVIAIPNDDDEQTLQALRRLQQEFAFLEVMPVPATSDPSWDVVWSSWDANPKAYWWHAGKRAGDRALPPKKTRQLIWALYQLAPSNSASVLSYLDADSVVPPDYWRNAAVGMQQYDVLQSTNIAGNLLASWPASFFAMDHICWDATMYKHMSAGGRHPFWVLGKGLFTWFQDVVDVGGFHPWLAIEDPEVGMRLWANGARLGIIESPLVEEVPATWAQGALQRKRWVAGFYQSLSSPMADMGMPLRKRMRARLNFVPCVSLWLHPIGIVVGGWTLILSLNSHRWTVPLPLGLASILTMLIALSLLAFNWYQAWALTKEVLPRRSRLRYALRVNPVFLLAYWLWWSIPLARGLGMFLRDDGLVWERTEKVDANRLLIRHEPSTAPVTLIGFDASSIGELTSSG